MKGIVSLHLLPLELEAADIDPSLSILELRASLSLPLEALPYSLSGVNLFWCSTVTMMAATVPLRALYGIIGGSGVPNLR